MEEMEGEDDVQAGSRRWATRQQKHTQLHAVFYEPLFTGGRSSATIHYGEDDCSRQHPSLSLRGRLSYLHIVDVLATRAAWCDDSATAFSDYFRLLPWLLLDCLATDHKT